MAEQSEVLNGKKPLFEKKITLGNIIQAIVLLVAIVLAYAKIQSTQELLRMEYESQKIVTDELKQQISQQYVRSDVHNEQLKAINGKLQDIQDDLKDIKHTLKR